MEHIQYIADKANNSSSTSLVKKLSGEYYTHKTIAVNAISILLDKIAQNDKIVKSFSVIDPFAGDGRLVCWLIEEWVNRGYPSIEWNVNLWDLNGEGLSKAENSLLSLKDSGVKLSYSIKCVDSFYLALDNVDSFDIVITNPPWELLKPDRRELSILSESEKENYKAKLKKYDSYISRQYPLSQPLKKFAGWGTNLSRVGLDLCLKISKSSGYILVVLPVTFFADEQSINLRKDIFINRDVHDIACYPAEAKLFKNADTSSSTLIFTNNHRKSNELNFKLSLYSKEATKYLSERISLPLSSFEKMGYIIPVNIGSTGIDLLRKFSEIYPSWGNIEKSKTDTLWAGREVDETGSKNWLKENGTGVKFIKGRMIGRFEIKEIPSQFIGKKDWIPPTSCNYEKIVWRDVSRPSQKRRMIATIVPPKIVAGNSLGVCYFKDGNKKALRILLGIMNSLCFEFQLRTNLATGHVSLSAIRKVNIPNKSKLLQFDELYNLVEKQLNGKKNIENKLEVYVAKYVYSLTEKEFAEILNSFPKLEEVEKEELINEYEKMKLVDNNMVMKIPNHKTGTLSELDLLIVNSVPPGGNWKNLPEDIPSQRVKQIRKSYLEGKGSRSTYYGRLTPELPSYTINTYFNRPGNGCHIHYEQNRVLSQREAARLQSFPDSFIFSGGQGAVNTQIGNAVPPLLAYQIAIQINNVIGCKGNYVDLFSGAGGLGLGFKWAGWKPVLANDIDKNFLKTYSMNVHHNVLLGSISDRDIFDNLVEHSIELKKNAIDKNLPFWVLGGPPCQGFSTAGNKRSMKDERNQLFYNYVEFLEKVKPDGFVFENVAGLLSMEKGEVFKKVKQEFKSVIPNLNGFVLNSENYAIPQRRKRVFLIGQKDAKSKTILPPLKLTSLKNNKDLFTEYPKSISVSDALSDLPDLTPGQDGSSFNYKSNPKTKFQNLMRGNITPQEYLNHYQ
jgi:DNA (cytosine-5)-methyltransferase 1